MNSFPYTANRLAGGDGQLGCLAESGGCEQQRIEQCTMQADPSLADHLRQLEERLLQPKMRKSTEALCELLADEFIEFGSSGRIFDKRQIIESVRNEPPVQRSLLDFKTSVLAPGVVLATYRIVRHGASGAQSVYSLRSSIWKLIGGRWQMLFHQGTLPKES
jgi:hypothetical protein